jgi:hypothetical protein
LLIFQDRDSNNTSKPQENGKVLNCRRRKDKRAESSIQLVVNTQTLKQQKQVTGKNHHIYISILTLNVNELNSTIKRHHLANWIKKEDLIICCL